MSPSLYCCIACLLPVKRQAKAQPSNNTILKELLLRWLRPYRGPDELHSALKPNLVEHILLLQLPQGLGKADGIALRQQVMAFQGAGRPLQHPYSFAHKQNVFCDGDSDTWGQCLHGHLETLMPLGSICILS